jgi:hypothetical protein
MPARKKRSQPAVGNIFERTYKGKIYKLKVVRHEGDIMFELEKKLFASPSGAAKTLTLAEVNGWRFWNID